MHINGWCITRCHIAIRIAWGSRLHILFTKITIASTNKDTHTHIYIATRAHGKAMS